MDRTIGQRVKLLRDTLGLTQRVLADRVGITQPSLSLIEAGETKSLAGTTLDGLCRELRTTASFLLNGAADEQSLEDSMSEAELVQIYRRLPPAMKTALIASARGIFSEAESAQTVINPVKRKLKSR